MGRVYAIASAKGGVGKTTTTAKLGASLVAAGHRVAVVDADIGMPNLGRMLGVSPDGPTLHDVLAGEADPLDAVYEGPEGLAVVPGSSSLGAYAKADPRGLDRVLNALSAYDLVLVDTGAGLSHDTLFPLGLADAVVLVSTPSPDALGDTKKTDQLAARVGVPVAGLVLARVDPAHVDVEATVADIGVDLLGVVPEDRALGNETGDDPAATPHADADTPAAAAYRTLADAITADAMGEAFDEAAVAVGRDDTEPTDTEDVGGTDTDGDSSEGDTGEDDAREAEDGVPAGGIDAAHDVSEPSDLDVASLLDEGTDDTDDLDVASLFDEGDDSDDSGDDSDDDDEEVAGGSRSGGIASALADAEAGAGADATDSAVAAPDAVPDADTDSDADTDTDSNAPDDDTPVADVVDEAEPDASFEAEAADEDVSVTADEAAGIPDAEADRPADPTDAPASAVSTDSDGDAVDADGGADADAGSEAGPEAEVDADASTETDSDADASDDVAESNEKRGLFKRFFG
ncbi:nucleotide-binding protein [Salinigranum halophilum]|uniref:nucleotide-binding protein n=1 Tax=Salinigranum halophilum TaxID=2565931 RepID=UPI0010A8419F|nr:P-loop NTPase [Salinigranum halophilum]